MEHFGRFRIEVTCNHEMELTSLKRREELLRILHIINTMISLKRCSMNFMFLTGPLSEIRAVRKIINECTPSNGFFFTVTDRLEYLRPPDDRRWFS